MSIPNTNDDVNIHNATIGHCNIQGGIKGIAKSTQIHQLIRDNDIDILSLNETNLDDTIHTDSLNIPPGFDFKRSDRGTGSGVGLAC